MDAVLANQGVVAVGGWLREAYSVAVAVELENLAGQCLALLAAQL